jgi:hypothetical protein
MKSDKATILREIISAVRMSLLHGEGRGFESLISYQFIVQ